MMALKQLHVKRRKEEFKNNDALLSYLQPALDIGLLESKPTDVHLLFPFDGFNDLDIVEFAVIDLDIVVFAVTPLDATADSATDGITASCAVSKNAVGGIDASLIFSELASSGITLGCVLNLLTIFSVCSVISFVAFSMFSAFDETALNLAIAVFAMMRNDETMSSCVLRNTAS